LEEDKEHQNQIKDQENYNTTEQMKNIEELRSTKGSKKKFPIFIFKKDIKF